MKKSLVLLLAVGALIIAMIAPAGAITHGEPDDGEHPYVGMMLFYDAGSSGWYSCTGTLLSEDVLLTAGHCAIDVGTEGEYLGSSGGTDMWVSFDEVVDLETFPKRADYPGDPEGLNQDRRDWLNNNLDFVRGTSIPHPEYYHFVGFPNTRDVGVVLLDEAQSGPYAELPEEGALDGYATKRGLNKLIVETTGYGIQEIIPDFMAVDERYKSTSMLVNLRSANTGGYNLQTSNNPGKANGVGGSCFGDSGGPVLLNDTSTVIAVVSFGLNYNCVGTDFAYRADISETLDFVGGYLP